MPHAPHPIIVTVVARRTLLTLLTLTADVAVLPGESSKSTVQRLLWQLDDDDAFLAHVLKLGFDMDAMADNGTLKVVHVTMKLLLPPVSSSLDVLEASEKLPGVLKLSVSPTDAFHAPAREDRGATADGATADTFHHARRKHLSTSITFRELLQEEFAGL